MGPRSSPSSTGVAAAGPTGSPTGPRWPGLPAYSRREAQTRVRLANSLSMSSGAAARTGSGPFRPANLRQTRATSQAQETSMATAWPSWPSRCTKALRRPSWSCTGSRSKNPALLGSSWPLPAIRPPLRREKRHASLREERSPTVICWRARRHRTGQPRSARSALRCHGTRGTGSSTKRPSRSGRKSSVSPPSRTTRHR